MLKIGVLGAGHLGKIHMKLINEIDVLELVGFYDPNDSNAQKAEEKLQVKRFTDLEELIHSCDAIDIVTSTISHFECARMVLKNTKHVFIEKPMTSTLEEAFQLVELIKEANVKAQIGHVERFNPAFLAVKDYAFDPMFIETHRLAQFNPRGTDVSVIHDLMIHDIDIILKLVNTNVKNIHASGVPIISDSPDIANARIEFDNGCVANVTASRLSVKNMRKTRIFQRDSYVSIDFLEKKTEIFKLYNEQPSDINTFELDLGENKQKKYIHFDTPEIIPVNSIKMELESFANSIYQNKETEVTAMDGLKAMEVAYGVLDKIQRLNII
ncbi:MAG: Gfo/Idh/MocA family oxidoreductase [Chitinophagales bacterium]|nr:Gfo/Idh/MocA family oxidoreductase [Chitinophagales bacterium]|tara:strand:+ start:8187 stop:9164 length:978 start_codon:yes stop_codon:yes gene_type:complete